MIKEFIIYCPDCRGKFEVEDELMEEAIVNISSNHKVRFTKLSQNYIRLNKIRFKNVQSGDEIIMNWGDDYTSRIFTLTSGEYEVVLDYTAFDVDNHNNYITVVLTYMEQQ